MDEFEREFAMDPETDDEDVTDADFDDIDDEEGDDLGLGTEDEEEL